MLIQIVDTMNTVETQVLRGKGCRFLDARVVKEVETSMKELELKVVTAANISTTSVFRERVMFLKKQSENN